LKYFSQKFIILKFSLIEKKWFFVKISISEKKAIEFSELKKNKKNSEETFLEIFTFLSFEGSKKNIQNLFFKLADLIICQFRSISSFNCFQASIISLSNLRFSHFSDLWSSLTKLTVFPLFIVMLAPQTNDSEQFWRLKLGRTFPSFKSFGSNTLLNQTKDFSPPNI